MPDPKTSQSSSPTGTAQAHIVGEGVPADWRAFDINLPDAIAATETKLPLEITGGADLDEANPDVLANMLASGVSQQGGRSAIYREDKGFNIYVPAAGSN